LPILASDVLRLVVSKEIHGRDDANFKDLDQYPNL
jgi:hypothetical protein